MAKQWKHAIVGVGSVGEWHVNVLSHLPQCELVAVCDHKEANARKALDKNKVDVPIYTDVETMLEKHPELEICHISTPSGDHMDPAIACMKGGKNVICEKPMEIQLDRIDRMIAAAKENNVKLAGIFQNRWRDEMQAVKQAVIEGRFGKIAYAASFTPWWRTDEYYRSGDWRGTWALDGGGAIMNQSVHYVDMLQWLAGDIKSVSAYASNRIHTEIEVEDTLVCACEFKDGANGVIMGSTAMFPGAGQRIELGGDNGVVITAEAKVARFRGPDGKPKQDPGIFATAETESGSADPNSVPNYLHARNIEHILSRWEQGEEADTYGPEARKAVAIILAMYESAKKGGVPVPVE